MFRKNQPLHITIQSLFTFKSRVRYRVYFCYTINARGVDRVDMEISSTRLAAGGSLSLALVYCSIARTALFTFPTIRLQTAGKYIAVKVIHERSCWSVSASITQRNNQASISISRARVRRMSAHFLLHLGCLGDQCEEFVHEVSAAGL